MLPLNFQLPSIVHAPGFPLRGPGRRRGEDALACWDLGE